MDITYPPEAEAYRLQIRDYLSTALPASWQGLGALDTEQEKKEFRSWWREEIGRAGLIAPSWPQEYGGAGLSQIEQVVLAEELARAGAPEGFENDTLGIKLLGNTLIELGSAELKQHFLPRILSGEYSFCQGFSEPEAGSDLAGMRTRAVRDGDDWILNGQKTWTSGGLTANWMFVVARTDPDQIKHKGLTFFLLDMNQPGVDVRPIVNAAGHAAFAEVFFTDARIDGRHVVGAVDDGWRVTNTLLGFERGVRVTTDAIRFGAELDKLVSLARDRGLDTDPHIRAELAWCDSRVRLIKYRGFRALTRFLDGDKPGVDGSISKLIWSEYLQRYTELAMKILALDALTPTGAGNGETLVVPEAGTPNSIQRWVDVSLYARAATIYGGSAQIQRNIIGERLLGLPKEPRLDDGPFSAPAPVSATA